MHTTQQLGPTSDSTPAEGSHSESNSEPSEASAPIHVTRSTRIAAPASVVLAHLQRSDAPVHFMWHVVDTTRVSESTWIWQFVLSRSLWWSWDCERVVDEPGQRVLWQSMPYRDPFVQVAFELRGGEVSGPHPGEPPQQVCDVSLELTATSEGRAACWVMEHAQAVGEQFVGYTLRQLQSWVEHGAAAPLPGSPWEIWREENLQ